MKPQLLQNNDSWYNVYSNLTFENEAGETLPYRLLTPLKIKKGVKYPLVIYFHGRGMGQKDNTTHLRWSALPNFLSMTNIRETYPAYVLVPNSLAPKQWVDFKYLESYPESAWPDTAPYRMPPLAEPMRLTMELLSLLESTYPIDTHRVYVTGSSMGGVAVWDIIMRYPEKFAAAVPFCGWGDMSKLEKIKNVKIWNFHGSKDESVAVKYSRSITSALSNLGSEVRYTELPAGHDIEGTVMFSPFRKELVEWMFRQTLK